MNIGGNKYRLIIEVFFGNQVVLIRQVLSHKVYDKGEWKFLVPAPKKEPTQHGDEIEGEAKPKSNGGERDRGSRQ